MKTSERMAELEIRLSEFEMPPMQDVLIIGREAPIGPEAARRMVEAVSPEQYAVLRVDSGPVEALVVRRRLLDLVPEDRLVPILLEEAQKLAHESLIVKGRVTLTITSNRQVML